MLGTQALVKTEADEAVLGGTRVSHGDGMLH
jgi:hypothetical protein